MNTHNLAQQTTWLLGSVALDIFPYYLKSFSIPGINFNHPEVYSRASSKVFFVADNINFNELSCTILIDENYRDYFELMNKVFKQFDPESGTFRNQEFDLFVLLQNQMGNDLFKIEFYNARLSSIGDIELTTEGDMVTNTLTVSFVYDYYEICDLDNLAKGGILAKPDTQ